MSTASSAFRVFPPTSRWLTATLAAAIFFCCRISRLRHGVAADQDMSGPFLGAASTRIAPDAQSHLRAEMRAELLLMAVGRHTDFVDGLMRPDPSRDYGDDYEALDQRQHLQAATALHLLQRLRFMEAMDEKLAATVHETAASVVEFRTAMQVFFETLQRKVEQDVATLTAFTDAEADVRSWYRGLPATRKRYASARTVAASSLLRILGRESMFVRRLAICTLFLEVARAGDERKFSKLARNVLLLAHNRDVVPHIERIFQAVVDETAADANNLQDGQRTLDILFQKLVEKMRSDTELNSESTRAKIR